MDELPNRGFSYLDTTFNRFISNTGGLAVGLTYDMGYGIGMPKSIWWGP